MAEHKVPLHLEMAIDLARLLEAECLFDFDLLGVALWLRSEVAGEQIGAILRRFSGEHAHG